MVRLPARAALVALLLATSACEDPGLQRLESHIERETIELDAISHNREQFEREDDELRRELARLDAAFEAIGSPEALARAIEDAGASAQRDAPPEGGVARGVLFRAGSPADVRAILALGRARRPLRVEGLRCGPESCAGELLPIARPELQADRAPAREDLGPRPWWPPRAKQWDRTSAKLAALEALRTALGPVGGIKARMEALRALREAVDLTRERAALVIDAAEDALAEGARTVRVAAFDYEDGYGARLTATGAAGGLAERLGRRGEVVRHGRGLEVRVEIPDLVLLRQAKERRRK